MNKKKYVLSGLRENLQLGFSAEIVHRRCRTLYCYCVQQSYQSGNIEMFTVIFHYSAVSDNFVNFSPNAAS